MTVRAVAAHRWRAFRSVAVAVTPSAAWLLLATFYYGFPLPNTSYAKVANGIPGFLVHEQGIAYLLNSVSHDPLTLGTIALAVLVAAREPGASRRAALSALIYVAYTVSVGGDFMSGRFFAMPFLVAVMINLRQLQWEPAAVWSMGGLVLYNVLVPIVPIKTTSSYDAAWPWRTQNGVRDERGHTHQVSNILFYAPFRELPDHVWVREATSFRDGPEKVSVQGSIGMWGFFAGPEKFIVDRNALSDPLLARLPVSPRLYFEFYAGHYFRDIPAGYLESVDRNQNLLQDPLLHDYYDRLRNVTRGPLFSLARVRDIWALNVGRYGNLHARYETRRPIELSVRADNERFFSDVGERDARDGTLHATGRAGYLEYGPRIPMRAGLYRARWIGTVESAPGRQVGFVEVWDGPGRRIGREPVEAPAPEAGHRLAHLDFTLAQPVAALEYRFYVNDGVRMTLERVELFSSTVVPPGE